MKLRPASLIPTAALITRLIFSAFPLVAQFPKLDNLTEEITKEIKPLKPRLIALADFRPPDGTSQQQGHYFALALSTQLQDVAKKNFVVADHAGFESDLSRLHHEVTALVPGDSFRDIATNIGAEVLVTGSLETRGGSYVLQVTPVRVASAEWLPTLTATIQSTQKQYGAMENYSRIVAP